MRHARRRQNHPRAVPAGEKAAASRARGSFSCQHGLTFSWYNTVWVTPGPTVFACPVCGDYLSSQDYLDKHILDTHAPRSQMMQHEETHSGASDDKPYSCPSCNKKFRLKRVLLRHQSIHTREKLHECTTCGQQFRDRSYLWKHSKLHSDNGKPHVCPYCGRPFRLKSHLRDHLVTHTGERRHTCRVCGKKFTQSGKARQHERQVHGRQIPSADGASFKDSCKNMAPKKM